MKGILRALLRVLFRVTTSGDATVFTNPRTLIVANHESLLDGVLLAAFLPVDATFVVHTEVTKSAVFRFILRFVPHLVVDSTSPLAIKVIIRLVESGVPVVIFPEGRLTTTGSLMKVYDGAGFVAARTGATVVPVHIEGSGRSYFGRLAGIYPRKLLPRISIAIQPRRNIDMPQLPSAKLRRRRAGELMRRILLDMLVASRPQRTLFEAFLDAKATFGSNYRLVEDIRMQEESYGSLLRMSLGLARLLGPLTRPGDMVGIMTPNAAPTLGLILALSATKRVPAMLNYTAGADGLRAACAAARIECLVTSRAFVEKARFTAVIEQLTGVSVLYLEDLRTQLGLVDKLWIVWHQIFPDSVRVAQSPDDPAIVLFTSGSEGKPKGVVHSHASILSNVAQIRALADFTPLDKFMIALPVFHSFGLTCGAIMPLVSGCKVFLYPSPLHYRIIPELVYDRNCTVLFGTSTFLGNYGKFAHPYDFGRLRYVVAGAERLADEVRNLWIEKFGIRVLEGYGVTECAPVVAVNVPMACRTGSVGQLVPGMQHRLEPVPGIGGGVLHVKGPNLMRGYLKFDNPGVICATGAIDDGWYNTGDIVDIDEEGFVHIRGRVKRFAKLAGEMVSLEVVEQVAARAAPGFAHAASTRPDAAKGEAIVLFTTSPTLAREQLSAAAKLAGAPDLAVPRVIVSLAQIPLLGTGKTDYVRLKTMGGDRVMSDRANAGAPLWSRGLAAVLLAQFLSALADNALLFGTLALLKAERYPEWTEPLLQEFFVGAYILLAPFAGPLADAWPKGRVMLFSNGLKLAGAIAVCIGLNPFLAYGLVGVGAATYSPAKYGILSELTSSDHLVKANGLMESSTIAAILIGAIAGGTMADWNIRGTLAIVAACYGAAAAANMFIPALEPVRRRPQWSFFDLLKDFLSVVRKLLGVRDARFSIAGTSLFWGAGSTMRFLLIAWVPLALGITNNRMPAYLNAVVAVGIILGAGLAAKFVTLASVNRALSGGVLLGVAVCGLSLTTTLPVSYIVLALVGMGGGFFVVPLNALLQDRGQRSVGAGQAIAVQNLAENGAMLVMIGVYTVLVKVGFSVTTLAAGFGAFLSLSIGALWLTRLRRGNP